jgi:hypothetical protein
MVWFSRRCERGALEDRFSLPRCFKGVARAISDTVAYEYEPTIDGDRATGINSRLCAAERRIKVSKPLPVESGNRAPEQRDREVI